MILGGFAGLEVRGYQPGIGPNAQALIVACLAAGQGDKTFAVTFRERLGAPGRRQAGLVRDDPDLENPGRRRFQVVLAVGNPGAGAHDLDVTRFGTTLVAKVVLVGNGAFADIGDDFHVAVRVLRETGAGSDHVVIPDPQVAPVHTLGIVVFGERKMMVGIQPAVVSTAERVERSEFKHDRLQKRFVMGPGA
ncbi:hypothetical protein D9M69_479460 [compost metagenome]